VRDDTMTDTDTSEVATPADQQDDAPERKADHSGRAGEETRGEQ